jgi:hypothetical protein
MQGLRLEIKSALWLDELKGLVVNRLGEVSSFLVEKGNSNSDAKLSGIQQLARGEEVGEGNLLLWSNGDKVILSGELCERKGS